MFTGLIEEIGTISEVTAAGGNMRLRVDCPGIAPSIGLGDSIAVDGACLTAETADQKGFTAFASLETLRKTVLGDRGVGSRVNLERALAMGDRLGGHLVSGHVDATGTFRLARAVDQAWEIRVAAPESILRHSISKGSITIDGISLTIVDLTGEEVSAWIIPETWTRTTLSLRKPGDRVNLESDMIGKYVHRMLVGMMPTELANGDARLKSLLEKGGWGAR